MAALVVMPLPPVWQQNRNYPADTDRTLVDAAFHEGVLSFFDLWVQQAAGGANMSVDVAAGSAVIDGSGTVGTRAYLVTSDAVVNLTITAAPASQSRIDLVVAKVRDAAVDGGANNDWVLQVINGTVAGSPVPPTVPDNTIVLARVTVTAGHVTVLNTSIEDRRPSATTLTVGTGYTHPAIVRNGHLMTESNSGDVFVGRGGVWHNIDEGGVELVNVMGSIFGGTPPAAASTQWKMIVGWTLVPFIGGGGYIDLPYTFSGIVHASFLPVANTVGVIINRRTVGSGSTIDGNYIPLSAYLTTGGAFGGTLPCSYQVIGW